MNFTFASCSLKLDILPLGIKWTLDRPSVWSPEYDASVSFATLKYSESLLSEVLLFWAIAFFLVSLFWLIHHFSLGISSTNRHSGFLWPTIPHSQGLVSFVEKILVSWRRCSFYFILILIAFLCWSVWVLRLLMIMITQCTAFLRGGLWKLIVFQVFCLTNPFITFPNFLCLHFLRKSRTNSLIELCCSTNIKQHF